MKKRILALCMCAVMVFLCGCQPEEGQQQAEMVELRWGIVDYEEDSFHQGQTKYTMEALRINKLNELLAQKGYKIRVSIEYLLEADKNLDLITFPVVGVGAEELQDTLVPLEPYFAEGQPLQEAAAMVPDQLWKMDQVQGHNYNFGHLPEIYFPVYQLGLLEETEDPKVSYQLLQEKGSAAIPQIVQEAGTPLKMAEPYVEAWGDELGIQCSFHMIAPGVGISIEKGEAFENVMESEAMARWKVQEMEWLHQGVSATYMEKDTSRFAVFRRGVSNLSQAVRMEKENEDGTFRYTYTVPVSAEGKMVPLLENCYTSILLSSPNREACLTLLNALNTDEELAKAIHEPILGQEGNRPTQSFTALCNNRILRGEDTVEERNARMEEIDAEQVSPILGFTFDARPVAKEVEALWQAQTTMGPMAPQVVREAEEKGASVAEAVEKEWQSNMEQFETMLEEAGIDRVIEEANRQLEAWKAAQGK